MDMRMRILLDEKTEKQLLYRSNFLGVSISSTVLLHLVLYHNKLNLTREDFKAFPVGEYRYLQIDVNDHVIRKYDAKPRFDNSISMLLSVSICKIIAETKTEWQTMTSENKAEMVFSTYSIEKDVINGMQDLKKRTGLTYTTIINYAASIDDGEPIDQLSLFNENKKKKQQGFQLTEKALHKTTGQAASQNMDIGKLLEIKLKKTLKTLDK